MADNLVAELGLSLGIGLVVGLERGWRQREQAEGSRVAGFRTFGLAGLLGGVSGALTEATDSAIILAASLIAFTAVFAWFKAREMDLRKEASITSIVAAIAVFAFGALAILGDPAIAAAGGVATACILASREMLHVFLRNLTWPEVRSALLLLAMTAIVLPLLPNRTVDPWGGINPWEIWFFTVLVAVISFAGYVAVRLFGATRGILVSAVVGAVVSSTAVTLSLARRSRAEPSSLTLAGGAALAAMVSATRVVVITLLVKPDVALWIAPPALAGAAVFGLSGWWLLARNKPAHAVETDVGNPLDVVPLAVFAITFALIAGASAAAFKYLGPTSVIWTVGLSGAFDADAATLSAVRLVGDQIEATTAAIAILLAVVLNAGTRVAVAMTVGTRPFGFALAAATGTALAVGVGIAFATGLV